MDKFKKSEENIVNFIVDSLKKTKNTVFDTNEKLTVQPISSPSNSPSNSPSILKLLFKLLAILLFLFIIYKLLETQPEIMIKLRSIFKMAEKEIKIIENEYNPMFDASNNLNSNEILDFLLGVKKTETPNEWCYFGESKGKRYCTLSQGNECMSGNIFPSQNICVNPKLKS